MNLNDKLILTDCDGVMVAWESAFDEWLTSLGYVKTHNEVYSIHDKWEGFTKEDSRYYVSRFNQSATIGWLTPYKDAYKYMRKLYEEHGYVFRVITSFEKNIYSSRLRHMNIHNLFGPEIFERIDCIGDECKSEYLKQYKNTGCVWIEDKVSNAEMGHELGLNTFLMDHSYNRDMINPEIKRVNNWKDIYEWIT